jgi:hypothetical protein
LANVLADIAQRIGDCLVARFDFFVNIGETRVNATFRAVYALFQPLETAADGHGNGIVIVLN